MGNLSYIPSFYFYRFADAVSSPYTALGAYSSGAIDANGNIKGNEGSIDPFEYFVIKIKKIFDQLPPGTTKYKLQNLMGTLQVFNEEAEKFGIIKEQFDCLVESHVMLNAEDGVSYLNLLEDMSTGSAGGGPGTLGTPANAPEANKGNVSGYDPVMGSMLTRSDPVNMFPSIEMFNVSKDEFNAFKSAKAWKQLQDSRTKKYLQRFQRRNKKGKMAVRDEESGEIFFIPYNEKSLIEELNLMELDILKETLDREEYIDKLKKDGISPIDPTPENVKQTFELQIDSLVKSVEGNKKKSEQGERAAAIHGSISSARELEDLIKSNSANDKELAAWHLGAQRHFAERNPSRADPYDTSILRRRGKVIVPDLEDVKFGRWSAPTPVATKEEEYGGLLPTFNGDDPFELYASAIEHGGDLGFVEDEAKKSQARSQAKQIQKRGSFQDIAKEMIGSKIEKKGTTLRIMKGLLDPGFAADPKEIAGILRNRTARLGLGFTTGKGIEEYKAALASGTTKPEPVKSLRRVLTSGQALPPSLLLKNFNRSIGNITKQDNESAVNLYGDEVNKFYQTLRGIN